jgi:hypothetical protein
VQPDSINIKHKSRSDVQVWRGCRVVCDRSQVGFFGDERCSRRCRAHKKEFAMKQVHVMSVVMVAAVMAGAAIAQNVDVRVTVTNLAPTNSVSFAPLRVGFNGGTYDSFNAGQTATAPIISIAEGGSGSDWFPAFAAGDPTATLGTAHMGPLTPGSVRSSVFTVNPTINRYFTFASMVVPSNDYFIGNDSPTQYRLFNMDGSLNLTSITQRASDIWDAGSEVDSVPNAAFIVGSSNDGRIADTGVVELEFGGLSIFNGLTTAAGYAFDLQLQSNTPVYRIDFEIVPAPGVASVFALGGLVAARRRRVA